MGKARSSVGVAKGCAPPAVRRGRERAETTRSARLLRCSMGGVGVVGKNRGTATRVPAMIAESEPATKAVLSRYLRMQVLRRERPDDQRNPKIAVPRR